VSRDHKQPQSDEDASRPAATHSDEVVDNTRGTKTLAANRTVVIIGYLAFWPVLYVLSLVVVASILAERPLPSVPALLVAGLTAWSIYILDRVKLRRTWSEPADAVNAPARVHWMTARAPMLRRGALCSTIIATLIAGWMIDPLAAMYPIAGAACAIAYAGRASPTHGVIGLKRIPWLKAIVVGTGLTLLASGLSGLGLRSDLFMPTLAHSIGLLPGLVLLVTADTIACDLDDEPGDRATGTPTTPVLLGRTASVIVIAVVASLGVVAAAWSRVAFEPQNASVPKMTSEPLATHWLAVNWWLGLWPLSTVMLSIVALRTRRHVRTMIDMRLALIVAIALVLG
jgi:hypothetical protein